MSKKKLVATVGLVMLVLALFSVVAVLAVLRFGFDSGPSEFREFLAHLDFHGVVFFVITEMQVRFEDVELSMFWQMMEGSKFVTLQDLPPESIPPDQRSDPSLPILALRQELLFGDEGELDRAMARCEEGLRSWGRRTEPEMVGMVDRLVLCLGGAYEHRGRTALARDLVQRRLKELKELGVRSDFAEVLRPLGTSGGEPENYVMRPMEALLAACGPPVRKEERTVGGLTYRCLVFRRGKEGAPCFVLAVGLGRTCCYVGVEQPDEATASAQIEAVFDRERVVRDRFVKRFRAVLDSPLYNWFRRRQPVLRRWEEATAVLLGVPHRATR